VNGQESRDDTWTRYIKKHARVVKIWVDADALTVLKQRNYPYQ